MSQATLADEGPEGIPPELVRVLLTWPKSSHAWQHSVYVLSDGAHSVFQVTDGERMLRASYPTKVPPGCWVILSGGVLLVNAEWPPAFNDFDKIAGMADFTKPKGTWTFDPQQFDFTAIEAALVKAHLRISKERATAANRHRASLHYRVQVQLGGRYDPMLAKLGPVEMLIMPCMQTPRTR